MRSSRNHIYDNKTVEENNLPEDYYLNIQKQQFQGASASQIGGKHYTKLAIQPWDYVIANDLDYFQGSIIKYVTRWRDKGGIDDLKKAIHFLEKYIEAQGVKRGLDRTP